MKHSLMIAQKNMRITEAAEICFLVRLISDEKKGETLAVDIRNLVDNSGSMDRRADGGMTKLNALKKSMKGAFSILRLNKDKISIIAFSNNAKILLNPEIYMDKGRVDKVVDCLRSDASTNLSEAMEISLNWAVEKGFLPKVVIFTDGEVNHPSQVLEEARCLKLAEEANKNKIPLAVFGVGISYNESFLRKLAEVAGNGSYFEHISQVGEMALRLEDDFANLQSVNDSEISFEVFADQGAKIIDAVKYVPQQADLIFDENSARDSFLGLETRGQAYLVKLRFAAANRRGVFRVANICLRWLSANGRQETEIPIEINFTDDPNLVSPADKTVVNTLLDTEATRATLKGNFNRAETLFTKTGNSAMANEVKTLRAKGEEAERTLRTKVSKTVKNTLSEKKGGKK